MPCSVTQISTVRGENYETQQTLMVRPCIGIRAGGVQSRPADKCAGTPVSTALPETTIRMMQKGFFLMSHSIQPEDHVNVRPFFYPVQGWGERLVQYNLCHKASVSVVLVL